MWGGSAKYPRSARAAPWITPESLNSSIRPITLVSTESSRPEYDANLDWSALRPLMKSFLPVICFWPNVLPVASPQFLPPSMPLRVSDRVKNNRASVTSQITMRQGQITFDIADDLRFPSRLVNPVVGLFTETA
jgi:hypothetical protein